MTRTTRWMSLCAPLCFFGNAMAAPGRLPEGALRIPLRSPPPPAVQYEVIEAYPSLTFNSPVAVAYPPDGSPRMFVLQQGGTIRVFRTDSPTESTEFANLTSLVRAGGELGLLGLAFDPHYAANGYLYVNYTAASPLRTVIARLKVSANDPNRADPESHTVLLEFAQPYSNHNGGNLAFGPDGFLYIATGDGGSGGDPLGSGQNLNTLLGKILRIDVRNPQAMVPANNPFVGRADARGEIWLYGLRNPWRFSFDRLTGALWIGDVGQNAYEEVDVIPPGQGGLNFGWNVCEGLHLYRNLTQPCTTGHLPIHEYDHGSGQSVIGGYVYRGTRLAALRGKYIYGDFYSRNVWAMTFDAQYRKTGQTVIATLPSGFNMSALGEDPQGELLLVGMRGGTSKLLKLQARTAPTTGHLPEKLSETGLFQNTANFVPHPDLLPYDVNAPLWSDSAFKKRWMALPAQGEIQFHPTESWQFPTGSVFVKHFEIPLSTGVLKRLETRVLIRQQDGWNGYTYRWNAAGTDADLLDDRVSEELSLPGRSLTWNYPSRAQCLQCHTDAAGYVLGFNTRQLNRDGQIENLARLALFSTAVPPSQALERFANPVEGRTYLSVNCSMCHQPGGMTPVDMDLRFSTPVDQMRVLDVPASTALGPTLQFRVASGSKEQSVLWERMRRLDHHRMPLIGSSLVDEAGVAAVGRWIDGGLR